MSGRAPLKGQVLRGLQAGSFAVGRATARSRMLPGFLIVGAQRCGTTSMFKALVQHPGVLPPSWKKGVHYFDKSYDRGPDWYRAHFPRRAQAERVRARVGGVTTGESSPYYMFHPLAPERMSADLPGVRLIVLVRDPVERAFSAYTHERARGFETEDFERALELEPERTAGERQRMRSERGYDSFHLQHNAYVERGQYVDQLERLAALVGRDRIHVVDSERFFAEPEPVYAEVLEFLSLPASRDVVFEQHNARPRAPMAEPVRARLDEHFLPYDERLAKWLDRTPRWRG